MILKELYIEDKYGVELSSWNDEKIDRTQSSWVKGELLSGSTFWIPKNAMTDL